MKIKHFIRQSSRSLGQNYMKQPTLILYNGTIQTQDAACPQATAVAVAGARILAVGADQEILPLAVPATRVIDLEHKLALPGLIDSHIHFYDMALNYDSINCSRIASFAGLEQAVAAKAARLPAGQWILGQGMNESDWPENRLPDRYDLDRVAPEHSVCIWRCDLHLAVANSLALERAGIGPETPDPAEGVIFKDAAGVPTGVLRELATNLIKQAAPPLSEQTIQRNMRCLSRDLLALGVTSVHDIRLMGGRYGADALRAWQQLDATGQIELRCHVTLPGEMTEQAVALGLRTGFGNERLKIGHLKFFADGGMGARTAWMLEPYLDAEYGMALTPAAEIERAIRKADAAGLSAMVHCVGTRANHEIITMFERLERGGELAPLIPHRIEHLQMLDPDDLAILGRLRQTVASCHPNNLSLDISMIEQCVGKNGKNTYMLKSILDTGVPLLLGSDAPVCDPNPLAGVYSAVTRKRMNRTPEQGWHTEQALTVAEAVRGYTITPAAAAGVGERLGSITPGKFADLIVLNQNIYTSAPDEIADVGVELTIFDGRVVS